MAEDTIGFNFFNLDQRSSIANEHAVEAASQHLHNQIAHEAAFHHLGAAIEAVSNAAERKFERGLDRSEDDGPPDFVEGGDFLF